MVEVVSIPTERDFGAEFSFEDWQFDAGTGLLRLNYHDAEFGSFTELFQFPTFTARRYETFKTHIDQAIECLFWLAGISYYKTSLAKKITFSQRLPSVDQAQWLTQTYQAGLAELAFQNNLGWLDHIEISGDVNIESKSLEAVNLNARSLVAIGGGKDSLVSIEAVKNMREAASLFVVGQSVFIQSVAAKTGLELIQVTRKVDPKLSQANASGAFNGHIPITAINAAVATVTALLCDFDSVVFSNERSADVGNVTAQNGQWVNHQYSKSLAYETAWQRIIKQYIAPDLHCFSLLRPFSELAIIKRFAQLPQYFAAFSSCNRNFHLTGSKNQNHHWCGECPKCAFVFLCLAPFVDRAALLNIFKQDLLANEALDELFESLIGIAGIKPFECVGEQQECQLSLKLLSEHPDWQAHQKISTWLKQVPEMSAKTAASIMQASAEHIIPSKRNFQHILSHVD